MWWLLLAIFVIFLGFQDYSIDEHAISAVDVAGFGASIIASLARLGLLFLTFTSGSCIYDAFLITRSFAGCLHFLLIECIESIFESIVLNG